MKDANNQHPCQCECCKQRQEANNEASRERMKQLQKSIEEHRQRTRDILARGHFLGFRSY